MDENTIPEPSLEDSIRILLMQVPLSVRNFILNELPQKTEELMTRYQLHIDQGGILERELLLMLLGQEQPTDFVAALQELGLSADNVTALTNDINTEVFMKLREAEEKSPQNMAPVTQAPPPYQPVPAPPAAVPASVPPPAPAPAMPTVADSLPPPQWMSQPVAPVPASIPITGQPETHDVRTMASDMELVKSRGLHETPAVPAASVYSAPPPVSAPVMPKPAAPQSENRDALHKILKQYGIDPYREPPE